MASFLGEQSGAAQPDNSVSVQNDNAPEGQTSSLGFAASDQLWTGEVDRLFRAALDELRWQVEQGLDAVEKRRVAEITELSRAIKKQHRIIEALKRELAEAKQTEILKLSEAEQQWQRSETERMNAARQVWEREKEELTREANRQRSVAEQLADQLAALKAKAESNERQLCELKKIAAEIDRSLLRARAEWENEVARYDSAEWQLPSFLTKSESSDGT